MRAHWRAQDVVRMELGALRFQPRQAAVIRANLAARRVVDAASAPEYDVQASKPHELGHLLISKEHSSAAADSPQSPAPRPTLNLELRSMTTYSPAALAEARETLTQIYHAAGIGVQWKTVEADFTVFVISRLPPAVRVSRFALGYVPSNKARGGRHAFVLADRIRDRSSELVVSFQLVLGLTMAHEVAHLLLSYESHSVNGLMRSVWNASDYRKAGLGQLLFTDAEAQMMRDRLSAEPVAAQAEP